MNVRPVGLVWAALLAVVGCAVGPDYRRPKIDVPATYPAETRGVTTAPAQWWTAFHDPKLDKIMELAVASNLDLRQAVLRVATARAQRDIAAGGLFPQLDGSASATRSRYSANAFNDFPAPELPGETSLFQAGFDAAWEIDLFGGLRRAVEAAGADAQAAVEDRRAVLLTLMGDVAESYVELRGYQRQVAIAIDTARADRDVMELTRSRFNAGMASSLDVARAAAQVSATESVIPTLQGSAERAMRRLSVLTGREPMALWPMLADPQALPLEPPLVPLGLPADLLRRRPDIRKAESQLAAATARIGVAKADLYPKLSLTGSIGLESQTIKPFANWASRDWSVGPSVTWAILDAGQIRANIRVQDALTEQALAQYQSTVLTSIQEVEDDLAAYTKEQERRRSLAEAVDADRQGADLSTRLYTRGLVDFLSVLQAQRDLYAAQDQLAQSDRAISSNFISLCKALGGGWETMEARTARR